MRSLAIVVMLAVSACGLTLTRGPDPHRPANQRPHCTESFGPTLADGVGAMLGLITLFVGVALAKSSGSSQDAGVPIIVGGAVVMAGAYTSGAIGYRRIRKCREAVAAFEQASGSPASR